MPYLNYSPYLQNSSRCRLPQLAAMAFLTMCSLPTRAQTSEQPPVPAAAPAPTASATAAPKESSTTASSSHSRRLPLGVNAGVFLPGDSKTRNRFGSSWLSIGIGIGAIQKATAQGGVGLDFSVLYQKNGGNHAFIAPIGLVYRRAFNADDLQPGHSDVPYYGASADLVLSDLCSPADNVHSGFNAAGGGSVFIGTTIGNNSFIQARYLAVPAVKSFNLSGFDLSAGIRF